MPSNPDNYWPVFTQNSGPTLFPARERVGPLSHVLDQDRHGAVGGKAAAPALAAHS